MRFLLIPGPSKTPTPPAAEPSMEIIEAQMRFNEEMYKAGVLEKSEGLNPAGPSAHVVVSGGKRTVIDGPYAETKELTLGFYLINVKSMQEAIDWAMRYPSGMGNDDVIEIRPLTGAGDIPAEFLELIRKFAPTWSASFAG